MSATDHPFQPGVEVAFVIRSGWDRDVSIRRVKVAKVHNTGNFTVEGSPQQYQPRLGWGRDYGCGGTIAPITPELLAEVAQSELDKRARAIIDVTSEALAKLRKSSPFTAETVANLEHIAAKL